MIPLNKLALEIHRNAVNKGFYQRPVECGTRLMLVVSELSEALEADRKQNTTDLLAFDSAIEQGVEFEQAFEQNVKDTFDDEITDAIIRLFDLCADEVIDIERHIELKMRYNQLRPYKHGKQY